jgi:hypothetical protein
MFKSLTVGKKTSYFRSNSIFMTSKIDEWEDVGMQNIPLVTTPGHVH